MCVESNVSFVEAKVWSQPPSIMHAQSAMHMYVGMLARRYSGAVQRAVGCSDIESALAPNAVLQST
jgi:hypothetical protein